ncbi:MAG TPA: tetratricopeptide repeat protein [candidate division WOR-3 bacterium]|uniref:Tetratricopeptide repeat protein n=1 Tax=candidate division WOR-3 bacterium TaxID=2052148 RepID=A0A7V0T698_UNCW3|nr:tetratricopeptide repeat protein [candidate division WOR-3 bacterium]
MKPFLLLLVLVTGGLSGPVDSLCDRAEFLLFNRHEGTGRLDSARSLLIRGRRLEPKHERCLYLWSRIHIQQGDDAKDKGRKLALYERARAIADTLRELNDGNPLGHMWWGVAQGRIGQTRGVLNSLFMVPSLRGAFNRVLELDPGHTTAYDALGVLYCELPGFVGGDLAKSEQYLRRGLELDPNYTVIRLDLARNLVKQKRRDEARVELERLIATESPTLPADFELDDKPEARALLKQLSGQ